MDTGRVESINWRWSLRRVSYRDYTQRNYFVWKFQEFLYAIHSIFKWIDRSPHCPEPSRCRSKQYVLGGGGTVKHP
jgi:hypothetical protein